jgi:hypothetical protein
LNTGSNAATAVATPQTVARAKPMKPLFMVVKNLSRKSSKLCDSNTTNKDAEAQKASQNESRPGLGTTRRDQPNA